MTKEDLREDYLKAREEAHNALLSAAGGDAKARRAAWRIFDTALDVAERTCNKAVERAREQNRGS